jgi:hypothetical protein
MTKLVCSHCKSVYSESDDGRCPRCGARHPDVYDFENSEYHLKEQVPLLLDRRREMGLEGLVGGLDSMIVNVQPDRLDDAVTELLDNTGMRVIDAFSSREGRTFVLGVDGPNMLLTGCSSREPFRTLNLQPKTSMLPDTRLETLVFKTNDVESCFEIQSSMGVEFMTDEVLHGDGFSFVQTMPSRYTGNSIGLLERGSGSSYRWDGSVPLEIEDTPKKDHLDNIGRIDHAATRIHSQDRDPAILEFISLTNYDFDFAIYVKNFNSITSVARLSKEDYAMVFTSGISPHGNGGGGPTEQFVSNYGPRIHHLAYQTERIEDTYQALMEGGQGFMLELVGSPEEGLRQTFTSPSPNTMLVNEYIHRYGDFDGFFTKSNVTRLTEATGRQ